MHHIHLQVVRLLLDTPVENSNNKPMYVLADGDHDYTLNHDLKRLNRSKRKRESLTT